MEPGASHCILDGKRTPLFQAVNAFVLRSMVLVNPSDILHGSDNGHICQENGKTHHAFQNGEKRSIPDIGMKQQADSIGKCDKNRHRQNNGEGYRKSHEYLFRISFGYFVQQLVRFGFFRFIIFVKAGGIGQSLHSQHKGIYKIKNPSDKRQLCKLAAGQGSCIFFFLDFDVSMIDDVYVAGGIGSGINMANAVHIGMFPDIPLEKFHYIGNSSLTGAYLMLHSTSAEKKTYELASNMTYLELSTVPTYMDEFVGACFIPHTDTNLFPSVMEEQQKR